MDVHTMSMFFEVIRTLDRVHLHSAYFPLLLSPLILGPLDPFLSARVPPFLSFIFCLVCTSPQSDESYPYDIQIRVSNLLHSVFCTLGASPFLQMSRFCPLHLSSIPPRIDTTFSVSNHLVMGIQAVPRILLLPIVLL